MAAVGLITHKHEDATCVERTQIPHGLAVAEMTKNAQVSYMLNMEGTPALQQVEWSGHDYGRLNLTVQTLL